MSLFYYLKISIGFIYDVCWNSVFFINYKRWVYERFLFRRIMSNIGDIKSLIDFMLLFCLWDVLWNYVMIIMNFDIDKWVSIGCSGLYW